VQVDLGFRNYTQKVRSLFNWSWCWLTDSPPSLSRAAPLPYHGPLTIYQGM